MNDTLCAWCKSIIEGDISPFGAWRFHPECLVAANRFCGEYGIAKWNTVVMGSKIGVRGEAKIKRKRRPPCSACVENPLTCPECGWDERP
jgi:hypothetical protein